MDTIAISKLAIDGGRPAIDLDKRPQPKKRWGNKELDELKQVLDQQSLFYWNGGGARRLVSGFQKLYPLAHVMPCSSGTAAIHIAILSMGLVPGDEVITSPITDQGTLIGILYQQGVPVFADVDPHSYNLDPSAVAACITDKTRAIVAVHLAGNPCKMSELKAIAAERNIVLIEDCAQAWGAEYNGSPIGTIGDFGCFSLNDFKHIGCGDGGIVGSNHAKFGPMLQMCGDKAYDRVKGGRDPEFLAPCYRMSEPQAAVAAAQVSRIPEITEKRNRFGNMLNSHLSNIPGIHPHKVESTNRCSFWFYMLRIDNAAFRCSRDKFAEALAAEGVMASAGYIPTPVYKWPLFQQHNFFGGTWPIRDLGYTKMDYKTVECPNAEAILDTAVRIEIKQWMSVEYIDSVAKAIQKVASHYAI